MKLMKLLDELDLISEFDKDRYQKLDAVMVDDMTEKAALMTIVEDGEWISTRWIPKSQLRTDFDGHVYLSDWLYTKLT